jgi:hypothetical protein
MKHIILNHNNKTARVFSRKIDAIYEHIKCKRGKGFQYKEVGEIQASNVLRKFNVIEDK